MRSLYLQFASSVCGKTGLSLCLILTACSGKKHLQANSPVPIVDVIIAKSQAMSNPIEVNGTIVANQYIALHPEVAGRITYLNVQEGKKVRKGTVIARINDEDLVAQLDKSKVLLELAIKTEERMRELLAVNGINQSEYDSAVNQVKSIKADIVYYQALIDKTIIRAPFDGVVGLRRVSIGAYVSNTDVIATLQQMDNLKCDFLLPDQYSTVLHNGSIVYILPDGLNPVKEKAVVVAIEPQANIQTRNLEVRASVRSGIANAGAFVKVYIDGETGGNAILVPTGSVIPDDKSKKVVVVKGGKSIYVDVTTGARQNNTIAITQGLQTGDTVVTEGLLFTRANSPVKVRNIRQMPDTNK